MKQSNKKPATIASILIFSIGLMLSSSVVAAGGKKATQVALDAAVTDLQEQINDIPSTSIYEIGDTGPAGGFVFFVDSSGQHGLEAAPSDQSAEIHWYNGNYTDTGAHGDGVGAGKMNTMLIIANQGIDFDNYAAGLCANLVITNVDNDAYGDWYLPSKEELNLMYVNLHIDGKGGFASDQYLSSTEYNILNAWFQAFKDGYQFVVGKGYTLRVRAVRAF